MMKEDDTCILSETTSLRLPSREFSFLEAENEQLKERYAIWTPRTLCFEHRMLTGERRSRRRRKHLPGTLIQWSKWIKSRTLMTAYQGRISHPDPNSQVRRQGPEQDHQTVLNPPPTPLCASVATKISKEAKLPRPTPPPLSSSTKSSHLPMEPVRRVPEVLERYRSLTRKESKLDTRAASLAVPSSMSAREMIGGDRKSIISSPIRKLSCHHHRNPVVK